MYKIPCEPEGIDEGQVGSWTWLGKRGVSDEHVVAVNTIKVCVSSAVRFPTQKAGVWTA